MVCIRERLSTHTVNREYYRRGRIGPYWLHTRLFSSLFHSFFPFLLIHAHSTFNGHERILCDSKLEFVDHWYRRQRTAASEQSHGWAIAVKFQDIGNHTRELLFALCMPQTIAQLVSFWRLRNDLMESWSMR